MPPKITQSGNWDLRSEMGLARACPPRSCSCFPDTPGMCGWCSQPGKSCPPIGWRAEGAATVLAPAPGRCTGVGHCRQVPHPRAGPRPHPGASTSSRRHLLHLTGSSLVPEEPRAPQAVSGAEVVAVTERGPRCVSSRGHRPGV